MILCAYSTSLKCFRVRSARIHFDEGRQSRSVAVNKNCAVPNHCAVRGSRDYSVGIRAAIRCRICPHETAGAFLVQQLLFLVMAKYLPQ